MFFTKDMMAWGALFWILYIIPMPLFPEYEEYWRMILYGLFLSGYIFFIFKPGQEYFKSVSDTFPVFFSYFRSVGWIPYFYSASFSALYFILSVIFLVLLSYGKFFNFQGDVFILLQAVSVAAMIVSVVWHKFKTHKEEQKERVKWYFKGHFLLLVLLILMPVNLMLFMNVMPRYVLNMNEG